MSFPDVKFGICQMCGAKSGPQTANLTTADAAVRSTPATEGYDPGNGVILERYKGKLACGLCIATDKNDDQSLLSAKKHAEAERFRAKAGFNNKVV